MGLKKYEFVEDPRHTGQSMIIERVKALETLFLVEKLAILEKPTWKHTKISVFKYTFTPSHLLSPLKTVTISSSFPPSA